MFYFNVAGVYYTNYLHNNNHLVNYFNKLTECGFILCSDDYLTETIQILANHHW